MGDKKQLLIIWAGHNDTDSTATIAGGLRNVPVNM